MGHTSHAERIVNDKRDLVFVRNLRNASITDAR